MSTALLRPLFALSLLVSAPTDALAEAACPSVDHDTLEQRMTGDTQRYDIAPAMLGSFVHLLDGRRPTPQPDRVTVYARPSRPLLVAYSVQSCVLALLPIKRRDLWRILSDRLGSIV